MVWPSVEFGLNLLMFLDSLSRSLMVILGAAPRSVILSLTGKSYVAKAGEVLGCGPLLLALYTSSWTWDSALFRSGEAEGFFSHLGFCSCS